MTMEEGRSLLFVAFKPTMKKRKKGTMKRD